MDPSTKTAVNNQEGNPAGGGGERGKERAAERKANNRLKAARLLMSRESSVPGAITKSARAQCEASQKVRAGY